MSSSAEQIFLPGPLHPDLFDGETPTMCRVDPLPRVWLVSVSVTRGKAAWERVEKVVAVDEQEAGEIALERLRRGGEPRNKQLEVLEAEAIDQKPNVLQLRAWWSRCIAGGQS